MVKLISHFCSAVVSSHLSFFVSLGEQENKSIVSLHKADMKTGWWGLARHANYVGDLILSFAMCATCGSPFHHVLPWFYAVYMTVLLLHRCRRDEKRCQAKYGVKWDEYVKRVPWKLIPGLY